MGAGPRGQLDRLIVQILRESVDPLTIPQIEEKLAATKAIHFDTFDVRDAVWRLIADQEAESTPRRYVRAAR